MSNITAERLLGNQKCIMDLWAKRASKEVASARGVKKLALENSLSEFLEQLAEMLETNGKTDVQSDREAAIRKEASQAHGKGRAARQGYLIQEVIFEYHILRQVLFQVLEAEAPLPTIDRDTILNGIESAVNDSATQFSNTLRDIREELTLNLTHDLRTPLTAAKSAAQLIIRRPDNPDFCSKSAHMISSNMDRLDRMIQDILTASRIRAGESLPTEQNDLDLAELAQDVLDELSLTHPGRLHLASEGRTQFTGTANQLKRVFENLVGNALKYGKSSAPVTVRIEGSDESIKITVHNEGNPIPPEQREILFEQFRRLKSGQQKTGWGLGLMLVRGIVEAHGGSIRIESSSEKGTDFIVIFHRAQNATQARLKSVG